MNLTIKSKDGLAVLQKVYEGYESTNIQKDWQIESVNDEGVVTELSMKFNPDGIPDRDDGHLLKMIALETLRIKQMQYLKRYKPDIKNIYEYENEDQAIPSEVMAVALDSIESSYYVNLITILLSESLMQGRDILDLTAFARFNLKDYNIDFENKVKELQDIKEEIESGQLGFGLLSDEDWDGSFVGNPFEILRALGETLLINEDTERKKDVDITIMGREDGSFDVTDGVNVISRELVEDAIGFSFEVIDEDTDYDFGFENSMIMILYALIFLKTKIIYVDDKYSKGLKDNVSAYLENAGVYPEYSPYLIDKK